MTSKRFLQALEDFEGKPATVHGDESFKDYADLKGCIQSMLRSN